jgi:two-component system, OmpR family, sensor histidine kinase MtrB
VRLLRRVRSRLGLRARATIAFALGALLVSTLISLITYQLVRTSYVEQRVRQIVAGAEINALQVESVIVTPSGRPEAAIAGLDLPPGHRAYLVGMNDLDRDCLPGSKSATKCSALTYLTGEIVPEELQLRKAVQRSGVAYLVLNGGDGPAAIVGVPMRDAEEQLSALYFERVTLEAEERYLSRLRRSLFLAALVATLLGAGFGRLVSVRIMRPLKKVAAAATEIASGRLDARIDVQPDTDLDPLVGSFNGMAESMQQRLEREARFASDVSHELRTPLTSLSAAVQLLAARRDEMSDRSQTALDVLQSQTEHFRQLVLDLLEISRFDAGAAELNVTDVDLPELVRQVAAGHELSVDASGLGNRIVRLDKRRVERILTNLIQNAQNYAGGATDVVLTSRSDESPVSLPFSLRMITIAVDDAGPGIPEGERTLIFERFRRGSAQRSGATKGTGLGLSLVAEHARLHGGSARVEEAPSGGARFVVEVRAGMVATQEVGGLDRVDAPLPTGGDGYA